MIIPSCLTKRKKKQQLVIRKQLYEYMINKRWDRLKALVDESSIDLNNYDHGNFIWACAYNARQDILQRLYKTPPQTLLFSTQHGQMTTPLIQACGSASEEMMMFLLNVLPDMVFVPDRPLNRLPLFYALWNRRSPVIVQRLLSIHPIALFHKDSNGSSALSLFMTGGICKKDLIRYINSDLQHDTSYANILDGIHHRPAGIETMTEIFLLILIVLCRHGYNQPDIAKDEFESYSSNSYFHTKSRDKTLFTNIFVSSSQSWLPLHKAIQLQTKYSIPSIFLQLLVYTFSNQTKQKDSDGNLPLHLLLKQSPSHRVDIDIDLDLLNILLQMNPLAASAPCTQSYFVNENNKNNNDDDGILPLILAMKYGHSWESGIYHLLLQTAPHALSMRDSKTFLYPFMCASMYGLSLSGIYELLKMDPTLVVVMKS